MSTHKLPGDVGSREGTNTLSGQITKDVSAHSDRQQDCCVISLEGGWNQIPALVLPSSPDSPLEPEPEHLNTTSICEGHSQHETRRHSSTYHQQCPGP